MHCILTQDGNMKSKNKKIYTTPELEFLSNETTLMTPYSMWGVHPDDNEPWQGGNPDHDGIFIDKGKDNYNKGEYDPWDSNNW